MTTMFHKEKKCAVCGREKNYIQLGSSNSFGPCDLDLRPPEMMRSTMHTWIEECPFCGYVMGNISSFPENVSEKSVLEKFVYSKAYQTAEGTHFKSELAERFYKRYILEREFGEISRSFDSLLRAAWACDDAGDKENAVHCRKEALKFLDIMISKDETNENLILQKADILRRSGMFEEVIKQYGDKKFSGELLKNIASFQVEKSKLKDDKCYTVRDVKK